ncbi:MAG: Maf family protein [Steroidobacteraceae bacterium]
MTSSDKDNPAVLVLASASPRRAELLRQIGVAHRVLPVSMDESPLPDEAPAALVARLARSKARAGQRAAGGQGWALGADTVVVLAGEVFGKPRDEADGLRMLHALGGRCHEVLTAVALAGPQDRLEEALSRTEVTMRTILPAEAAAYWAGGEPCDKAGAYAIQGRAALFIERIGGSYSGVMGLPLFETGRLLQRCGLIGGLA